MTISSTPWFRKLTYGGLLDEAAERYGERPFLKFGERTWTFREARQEVDHVASALLAAEVEQGEVVAAWLPNRPEWLFIQLAVARIGATFLPINAALRESDCAYILQHSEASTLFFAATSGPVSYTKMLETIAPDISEQRAGRLNLRELPNLRRAVMLDPEGELDGFTPWGEFLSAGASVRESVVHERHEAASPDDIAMIMYTSGTTGTPKGVMHSHHAIRNVVDQANRLNVRVSDTLLMYLPLFHAYALYDGPLLSLVTGARCVLMARFDAEAALRTIEREKVTMCFGFATHFQDMLASPIYGDVDRTSLRAGILAVGPKSTESLARRVQRDFGGKIVSGYGMTEIGVGATLGFLDEDEDHSAATSGYPLPGYELRVIDPKDGRECDAGELGEVVVNTYQMSEGYFKDPDRTSEVIDEQGWLHTGDMGTFWSDGYLRILGRYKDLLRVGGENVDPTEVESLYHSHEYVASAIMVGVPDNRLEEVGCLCVLPSPSIEGDEELREELLHLADKKLAAYKRPRHVLFLESFPQTASGKIQRHELREWAIEELRCDESEQGRERA